MLALEKPAILFEPLIFKAGLWERQKSKKPWEQNVFTIQTFGGYERARRQRPEK